MKPAFSVLIFTVLAGAGSGLLTLMMSFQLYNFYHGNVVIDSSAFLTASVAGLVMMTLGLLSSTMHLANPKNAWRAFSRFRTSWLSREGVLAILFYPIFLLFILSLYLNSWIYSWYSMLLAMLSIAVSLATVYCTGMIYASLKPIRQWHNQWTTPIYLLMSGLSGSILLLFNQAVNDKELSHAYLAVYLVFVVITALFKWLYFAHIGKPDGATINSATGFSQAKVRLLDAGHSADTFLTNEFGFDPGALMLLRLRRLMALATFMVPIGLVFASLFIKQLSIVVFLAAFITLVGLLLERWLFFAEARHVVKLYHGAQAV